MNVRTILYSLRTVNEQTILSIDLTGKILSENADLLIIDLPTGETQIKKRDFLNKMIVYSVDAKLFFLICSKAVSREHAFKVLMAHAIQQTENRIDNLTSFKQRLQKELVAA